jgi:hypothetical protein
MSFGKRCLGCQATSHKIRCLSIYLGAYSGFRLNYSVMSSSSSSPSTCAGKILAKASAPIAAYKVLLVLDQARVSVASSLPTILTLQQELSDRSSCLLCMKASHLTNRAPLVQPDSYFIKQLARQRGLHTSCMCMLHVPRGVGRSVEKTNAKCHPSKTKPPRDVRGCIFPWVRTYCSRAAGREHKTEHVQNGHTNAHMYVRTHRVSRGNAR